MVQQKIKRVLDIDPVVVSESLDSLPPLAKYFNEKEQVCIRGIGWQTHGFVSQITREGIWLYQLNNAKEILYAWDCFEIVHTPGCVVYEISPVELVNIFSVEIKRYDIDAVREATRYATQEPDVCKWPVVFENTLGFLDDELKLLPTAGCLPSRFVLQASVNGAVWEMTGRRGGQIAQLVSLSALAKLVQVIPPFGAIPGTLSALGLSVADTMDVLRREGYDALRERLIKPQTSSESALGDPYIFEGGVLVDHNVFLTPQGYIAGSCHSKNGSRLYL